LESALDDAMGHGALARGSRNGLRIQMAITLKTGLPENRDSRERDILRGCPR